MPNNRERIATWWIHWQDLQWPDHDNLDRIKARAEGFAKANVTAAMLFGAHFRWDFLPVFPLLHDYIATVAEELHRYGIKLFDHHSVSLVHRYSTREEMRHVMLDSAPHLPFSPTFEAAKTWQYKGKYLNDWRMLDVKSREPLWFPKFAAEGFCHRNPEFREAYQDYAKYLIAETNIDGLSADDAIFFMEYNACGCDYCREELRRRAGIDLPPADDTTFWGNWNNPAWNHWIDLRFDAAGEFYEQLRSVLPKDFMLTGCGSSSASARAVVAGTDARAFLRGWNYVNMELSGNTPPYKFDKITRNTPIPERLVNASHHQAAAREKNVNAFCTGFAHSKDTANMVWALCKTLGADAWIGTLKSRLGLPGHILESLPSEQHIVGEAFTYEKEHPHLFAGDVVGQLGVFFSYETRNHTLYGDLNCGYYKDYGDVLRLLFQNGICPHTVFDIPKDPGIYPVIVLSGVARMTEQELMDVERYLAAGGRLIVLGPTAFDWCNNSWILPNRLDLLPEDFFTKAPPGMSVQKPKWFLEMDVQNQLDANVWQEPRKGVNYHPHRLGNTNKAEFLKLIRDFANPLPISVTEAKGFLCTMLRDGEGITVQLLAEDYDVEIDQELDAIRTHRSRVNLITDFKPIGTDGLIHVKTDIMPTVYVPFHKEQAIITMNNGDCAIELPKDCYYTILRFSL